METKNDGGAAFPDGSTNEWGNAIRGGMRLRDYFAAHAPAMPSGYARGSRLQADGLGMSMDGSPDLYASWAVAYADALLAKLAK